MQPEHQTRDELQTGAHGQLKLSNWVIGTVPTAQAAQACAQALAAAGFASDNVLVEAGATALRQLQANENGIRHAGILGHLASAIEDAAAEVPKCEMRDHFIADAQAGRVFVGARDAQGNQVDFIRNLFVEQGSSDIYYFEPTAITHLG